MRRFPLGLALVLLASNLPARGDDAELVAKSVKILETYCHSRHGKDGRSEGGFNTVQDVEKPLASKRVVAGETGKFKPLKKIQNEELPPEIDDADRSPNRRTLPKPTSGDRSFTNSIGMTMVLIPEGTFNMGSDGADKEAQADEKANGKKHPVKVSAHHMQTTEVTVGQFKKFVAATGYKTEAESDGKNNFGFNVEKGGFERDPKYTWRSPGFPQTDDHPVVLVSHNDAKAFLTWLSKVEGREYRLPTEAEWERDCRAGSDTIYSNGDDPEKVTEVGNVADATLKARYPKFTTAASRDGYEFTAPVGKFKANGFGLYDMHGNVWEWCLDGYDDAFYSKSPTLDPRGPDTAPGRVYRGGGWRIQPSIARSAYRSGDYPGYRLSFLGFRALAPVR